MSFTVLTFGWSLLLIGPPTHSRGVVGPYETHAARTSGEPTKLPCVGSAVLPMPQVEELRASPDAPIASDPYRHNGPGNEQGADMSTSASTLLDGAIAHELS